MYAVAPYNDALLPYIAGVGLGTYGLLDGLVRLPWIRTRLSKRCASVEDAFDDDQAA